MIISLLISDRSIRLKNKLFHLLITYYRFTKNNSLYHRIIFMLISFLILCHIDFCCIQLGQFRVNEYYWRTDMSHIYLEVLQNQNYIYKYLLIKAITIFDEALQFFLGIFHHIWMKLNPMIYSKRTWNRSSTFI